MRFHLNFTPPPSPRKISHSEKLLLTGSCFAENIGDYLSRYKFNCLVNPSGILFNPVSIFHSLNAITDNSEFQSELLVQNEGDFYSLLHHGDFHAPSREGLLDQIHSVTKKTHSFLKECSWLMISFGSAFVYKHKSSGHIVANCHKLPQDHFTKELLSTDEIVKIYDMLLKRLRLFNPELKMIFTISPVKYLRDGVIENNLSKAVLIQSVHEIIASQENCFYFPAYELVADDLRDYRFYKSDLAHPNEEATRYVWEKFSGCHFSEFTSELNERIGEIIRAATHRPINEKSEAHIRFKKSIHEKCLLLEKEFPYLDFEKEKEMFMPG